MLFKDSDFQTFFLYGEQITPALIFTILFLWNGQSSKGGFYICTPVPTPHILPTESRDLEGPFLSFMVPNLGAWFSHTYRRTLVMDDLETPLQFWKSEETKFILSSCAVSVKGIMNVSNFKRHIIRKIMWKVSYHLLCQIRRRNRFKIYTNLSWECREESLNKFTFFLPCHVACGILAPQPGTKPVPLRDLITGPPGSPLLSKDSVLASLQPWINANTCLILAHGLLNTAMTNYSTLTQSQLCPRYHWRFFLLIPCGCPFPSPTTPGCYMPCWSHISRLLQTGWSTLTTSHPAFWRVLERTLDIESEEQITRADLGSLIVLPEVPRARIWTLRARMAKSRIQGSVKGKTTSELWKSWMGGVRIECSLTASDYIKLYLQ